MPGLYPACVTASITTSSASRFDFRLGAKPPSSPTPVEYPFFFRMPRSVWKISAPARTASANDGKPSGITMNSWKSTLLSACAPPFRMFIIGAGSESVPRPYSAARCS